MNCKPHLWWKNGCWHCSASRSTTSYEDWRRAFAWTLWRNMDGSLRFPAIDPQMLEVGK